MTLQSHRIRTSLATLSKWYHRDVSIGGQRWHRSPEEGAALVSVDRATKAEALAILGNATYGDARQESVSPTAMAIEKTTFSEPAKRGGDLQKKGGVITAFASSLGPCVEDGGVPRSQSKAGDAPPAAKRPEGEAPCRARCRNRMAETPGSSETAATGPGTDARSAI